MKLSYDYTEMIQEINEDINDRMLSITDNIQILRSDKDIHEGYKPIIDWYYEDNRMIELVNIDVFDDEKDIEEKKRIKKHYEKDKTFLEIISVANCLIEMEEWNRII